MPYTVLSTENFGSFASSLTPVLVFFTSEHCIDGSQMESVMEQIHAEKPTLAIGKVDVDKEEQLAQAWVVFSVPAVLLLVQGETVGRWTGYHTAQEILDTVSQVQNSQLYKSTFHGVHMPYGRKWITNPWQTASAGSMTGSSLREDSLYDTWSQEPELYGADSMMSNPFYD